MSIYSEVRTLLGEPSGATYYTANHVCHAINEALLYVTGKTRHQHVAASLSFGVGASVVTIPSSIYIPQWIEYASKQWFPTTYARLEQFNQYWRSEPATQPKWFVLADWNHLRCWPDAAATYTFTLHGVPYPTEIDGSSVTDITDDYDLKKAVVYRAAASIIEHDFPQLADYFFVESNEYLMKANITKRNQQSHNIRRLRPGSIFTSAQSGDIGIGKRIRT